MSTLLQEKFVWAFVDFLSLVWLASIKAMRYSPSQVQVRFSQIFCLAAARKACAILLMNNLSAMTQFVESCIVLNTLLLSLVIRYRPEHFALQRVASRCLEIALVSNNWGMAYLFSLLIVLHMFHRKFSRKEASVELIKFRSAWKECINYSKGTTDDSRKALEVIGEHARCIRSGLSQQIHEARKSLSLEGKAFAWLEQRVGRWSLRGEGTGRQKESNLDLLMRHAGTVNEAFQDLISEIGFNGCSVNRRAGLEFLTGPIKQPMRTLEKLVRKYRRDVGCLTDLVRCTVIADSLADVMNFFLLVESMSVVGLADHTRQDPLSASCITKA